MREDYGIRALDGKCHNREYENDEESLNHMAAAVILNRNPK